MDRVAEFSFLLIFACLPFGAKMLGIIIFPDVTLTSPTRAVEFFFYLILPFTLTGWLLLGKRRFPGFRPSGSPRAVICSPFQGSDQAIIRLLAIFIKSSDFRTRQPWAPPPSLYSICIDFSLSPYKPANTRTKKVSIVRCEQIRLLKHTRLAAES